MNFKYLTVTYDLCIPPKISTYKLDFKITFIRKKSQWSTGISYNIATLNPSFILVLICFENICRVY